MGAFLLLAGSGLEASGRFPSGRFLVPPDEEFQGMGQQAIQGEKDFQKITEFPRRHRHFRLGTRIGHLTTGGGLCSGSLVGPDLFLTNQHCVVDDDGRVLPPRVFGVYMEYLQKGRKGPKSSGVSRVLKVSAQKDYALLRLTRPIGETYGWLKIASSPRPMQQSRAVKIIQHPRGRAKEIVLKNTSMVRVTTSRSGVMVAHYLADTEGGSSGSPVFSLDGEEIIALHHVGTSRFNEGIASSEIYPEIERFLPSARRGRRPVPDRRTGGGASGPKPDPGLPVGGRIGQMLGEQGW